MGSRFSAPIPHSESPPTGSITPSSIDSPSGTISDSDAFSAPPSRAPSRHPSISNGKPAFKGNDLRELPPSSHQYPGSSPARPEVPTHPSSNNIAATRPRAPSTASHDSQGKFTLKDLLASSTPKLARKSSNRSASSKKSDSDRGPPSTNGDSTASLLKKYGVCERVAIGKGATSVVRLAHKWDRSEEKLYAVKEFRKRRKNETEKEYVKKLTAEFCISSTLHHTNIVETVDLVQDEQQHWCEVMEYCPGGDLYAAIKKGGMSPSEVECCFKQILSGVSYLHSQGVAHRDIKPENLFFDARGHLKIGDYGASTVYRLPWEATVHMSTGLCGSEPYIAPEQFSGKPYDARLVDIWACGVVYYCLHFQELPWRVAQRSDPLYAAYADACAATSNRDGANAASTPATISNLSPRACRPVIRKMLDPDPKRRLTIEDAMAQPWVQGIEVCVNSAKPTHIHVHARSMLQAHADKAQ
ncbi:Pkinase-domain-containing protein [Sistotremastrum niveocremeum HHB9708]|uniref:non-specific serine/threonine protein kinase n=2 Tax=Sistotremastraceae TaxID=3402574 RepID=A0A164R8G4_9AGAM|nr:Pkinase-domain-containing protein [Sistotremastrum niveocremeum HHB9708]KZT42769.1 Pkinase-domain-containing protein [Sistotremastrum suecicum HHB10207 ss-3]